MLEIKNITKVYNTGGFEQVALDEVSVNFRKCEFAAILGPSGSGKTTLLNIIGGLDHYTSGDLVVNEISTKKFNDRDWDSYRNHRIGFVFQSYNLITHQTVLKNVELALTLSGVSKSERRKRAKEALKNVGLEKHINKKPNQLSGGQMQRVAIARALVNNPEIILADEPTGALDSETSIQIMDVLKNISKKRLVIMVTHNPDLAKEYANRIISIKDGKIIKDTNPYDGKIDTNDNAEDKRNKTKMSFLTALSLSFNNLMTKKGRTILVAFAGSIGIIGIALILAVSTGFQNYVDSIQEDTLTSYPLNIMQESTDITSALLSMRSASNSIKKGNKVKEQQYITTMLSSISTNDLKSFKKYVENNYDKIDEDISSIKYSYSVDPLIYTIDATNKLAKLNPSNLFSTMYGNSNLMGSYSAFASIFSQMIDDEEALKEQYDVLAGSWPKNYDEMIIVLSEPNGISDLLVYSLGLRDTEELSNMVTKIMSGEKVNVNNKPLEFTYDDLLNVDLRLIESSDTYKYNTKYDVYEDMTDDEEYMENLYKKATRLKIVGIVTAKKGTTSTALSPGVAYRKELIDHIINTATDSTIVKKQLNNNKLDVFSGKNFDEKKNNFDFEFSDLVSVDKKKLESAFDIKIDQASIAKQTEGYMTEISNSITTDITPARETFVNNLNTLTDGLFNSITDTISLQEAESYIDNYLNSSEVTGILANMEKEYVIPSASLKPAYGGLLKGLLPVYISTYASMDPSLTKEMTNPVAKIVPTILSPLKEQYFNNAAIIKTEDTMARIMTEAKMKKDILTKVGELTTTLMSSIANAFNVDQNKITSAFKLNFTEDELARVVTAMMSKTVTTQDSNLLALGYQDKEKPTYISFYFSSFDGKEHFLKFIDKYNKKMKAIGFEDKVINYSDTTGILMDSVKTIVNAVSYVLISFVSISLVVSSIMIGIITYISVYERTKEIGILRAIGASKHNISSIFNAETFIIGFLSGLFGMGITYILIPIINTILHKHTGNIPLNATLSLSNAIKLIVLSIILTLIGGLIPAKAASKKDPVEALRTE